MAVSYLYGKSQKPAWIGGIQTENIASTPTPSPLPTRNPPQKNYRESQPVITPTQNTPIPTPRTERKKVSFTTTEGIINGTYYCYEDRVNELTWMETEIKALEFLPIAVLPLKKLRLIDVLIPIVQQAIQTGLPNGRLVV